MKLGYQINTWTGVLADAFGVGSVKDAFYGNVIMPFPVEKMEEAFDDIATAGFQGVELFDGQIMPFAENPNQLVDMLKKKNLELAGVYSGANFIFKEVLPEELFKIGKVVKVAKSLGAGFIVLGGGALRHDGVREEDYKAAAYGLDETAKVIKDAGLKSCYHPHFGTIGFEWNQLERVMKFSSVNLCPDTAHIALGGSDNLKVVNTFGDRINYIHLKDLADGNFVELGEGKLPIADIVAALKKKGYDGWLTVELDATKRTPLESARINKKYLDKIL